MKKGNMKYIYLFLSIIGAILPYSFLGKFLLENGFDMKLFLSQSFATYISSLWTVDVFISAIVLLILIISDTSLGKKRFIPVIGTLTIGVSFGLPFYLYLKEINKK